nr:MAG TPA: Protein of unknown function (DUF1043) [Inoviridae sp.]
MEDLLCVLIFGVGIIAGCLISHGFNFFKW